MLELLARGLDNHAIARHLGKSEKTVRNQVSTIFDKLGVRTRAEAIVHAIGRARAALIGDRSPRARAGAASAAFRDNRLMRRGAARANDAVHVDETELPRKDTPCKPPLHAGRHPALRQDHRSLQAGPLGHRPRRHPRPRVRPRPEVPARRPVAGRRARLPEPGPAALPRARCRAAPTPTCSAWSSASSAPRCSRSAATTGSATRPRSRRSCASPTRS